MYGSTPPPSPPPGIAASFSQSTVVRYIYLWNRPETAENGKKRP